MGIKEEWRAYRSMVGHNTKLAKGEISNPFGIRIPEGKIPGFVAKGIAEAGTLLLYPLIRVQDASPEHIQSLINQGTKNKKNTD